MTHAVVFFLIGLGIAFLPGADSRRRGSSTISQDPIQILPGDYHFANKVNSSCLYRRQQYTNPEFLNAINTIRMLFNDLRKELDIEDCSGLTLTSLLPTSDVPNPMMTSMSSMHLSVTSMSTHLFVMKMDWMLSRGLPCVGLAKSFNLRRLHSRISDDWQLLQCMVLSSINPETYESQRISFIENLSTVLSTPILRYKNCYRRTVRDCILTAQSIGILESLQSLLLPDERTTVTI